MTSRRWTMLVLATLVILLHADAAWAQCAMCRRALSSPEGQQLVAALRSGILVLLAAPFLLFGGVATLAIRAQRMREDRADSTGAAPGGAAPCETERSQ